MAKKKYSGKLRLIGAGTWIGGTNEPSVIEIGEHTLRNTKYSDYLKNYLNVGEDVTIEVNGVYYGFMIFGILICSTIVGFPIGLSIIAIAKDQSNRIYSVEVDGKKYIK